MIGPLSADFHLVIPSIPGFGFSGPTQSKGWDIHRVARAWAVLMKRLGYQRYGAHGGDWGSGISRALGAIAPAHVVGVHLTYLVTPAPGGGEPSLSPGEAARLAKIKQLQTRQPAYQALHATRPQTISYALTDSPAGLLAWIAEKFTEWVDPRSTITLDQILADVSIYWFHRHRRLLGPPCQRIPARDGALPGAGRGGRPAIRHPPVRPAPGRTGLRHRALD